MRSYSLSTSKKVKIISNNWHGTETSLVFKIIKKNDKEVAAIKIHHSRKKKLMAMFKLRVILSYIITLFLTIIYRINFRKLKNKIN